jgi:monoamine oxidase
MIPTSEVPSISHKKYTVNNKNNENTGTLYSVNKAEIIVIGAGIAGIKAAHNLQKEGYKIIVLEGRSRIGGRVWTDRSWKNYSLDMGASWIHGVKDNPIAELAKKFDAITSKTDFNSRNTYDKRGRVLSSIQQENIFKKFDYILARVKKYRDFIQNTQGQDVSLQTAFEHEIVKQNLSTQEIEELNYCITNIIQNYYGGDISELSLFSWDKEDRFEGDDVVFINGYDQIIQPLAKGLDIRLNQVVRKIDYGNQGVTVTSNNGIFQSDKVIITLPLGVLKKKSVKFYPPLPQWKQTAINRLEMAVFNKLYLLFPQVFWDKDTHLLGHISSHQCAWTEFVNIYRYIGKPVLLAFNTGNYAWKLEKLSNQEIVDEAMSVLQIIYGNGIPKPEASLITRWGQDPFSFGAYSYLPAGACCDDYDILAMPVDDRLFFAGEATCRQYIGTVHGAFLSGEREAMRIGKKIQFY